MKKREDSALKLRERIKSKRPHFRRQESWRYKRLRGKKEKWRKAEGIDSKMRVKKKGWPKSPEVGYRGPKKTRGLHPSGFSEVVVNRPKDLDKIVPERTVARMAHTVGARKRAQILEKAKSMGIRVINPNRVSVVEPEEPEKTSS